MNSEIRDLLERHKKLKSQRMNWENLWQELAEVLLPRRADFTHQNAVDGENRTEDLFDSVPMQARRGLASSIDALLKPKTQKWFHIKATNEELNDDDEAQAWFEAAEDRMWTAIYSRQARFTQRSGEVDNDLVTLGTGVLYIGERAQLGGLTFRSLHLKDCVIAENGDGVVDTIFIDMELTARQAAQRYGEDNLGDETKKLLRDGKVDDKCKFVWCVAPRHDYDMERRRADQLPFKSLVIDLKSEHKVRESGYAEFPFAVPRWDTSSNEVYGRSPGMIALPDAQTLQAMGKTILMQAQYAVDPPKWVADEGVMSVVRTMPGGITSIDSQWLRDLGGRPPIGELNTGGNFVLGREMQMDTREQIWGAFFKNVLSLPVNGPQMTATEIIARKEELLRGIGPVFGQLETDYIGVIVERVFGIMLRAGALPPIPEVLGGQDVTFEFESPITKARKQIEAMAFSETFQTTILPMAQVDPGVFDHWDFDEIARDLPDARGFPHSYLRGINEVVARREARAKSQQAEQMMQDVGGAAEVASKVVPLLQQQGAA